VISFAAIVLSLEEVQWDLSGTFFTVPSYEWVHLLLKFLLKMKVQP
jgi:hypothetical protein